MKIQGAPTVVHGGGRVRVRTQPGNVRCPSGFTPVHDQGASTYACLYTN